MNGQEHYLLMIMVKMALLSVAAVVVDFVVARQGRLGSDDAVTCLWEEILFCND